MMCLCQYLQPNRPHLQSNQGPKAQKKTRTKMLKTRNPKKTENARTVTTLATAPPIAANAMMP